MKNKFDVLMEYFGYSEFREGQEEIIEHIVSGGGDALGIMPTGAGKSLCFQIPALIFSHITLVISPLISLMKDQVGALVQAGIPAAYINSSLSQVQLRTVLENAEQGKYRIIYVAPERLLSEEFLYFAQHQTIDMLTVDEAHCISQWGQDFRPSYLKINDFINLLPNRPVISAFTATATPQVRDDIVRILKLSNPFVLTTGFDRANLYFEVQRPKDKYAATLNFLQKHEGKSGIIYCSTRKTVEEVSENLCADGYLATCYHAGLPDNTRRQNQEDFIFDNKKIMVATNAFGMGIDKSNVSFVLHYNMPKNMESYYQEAGRAGRDSEPADCLLLYSGQDEFTNMWFIENSGDYEGMTPEEVLALQNKDRERLKSMVKYCKTTLCLRDYILRYFEDTTGEKHCGNCGNCLQEFTESDITVEAQKILSCVKRVEERFGANMVIDVLRGSKAEKVLKFGFTALSTYGIMSDYSADSIHAMIDFLLEDGALISTPGKFPLLQLTKKSSDILFHHEKVLMKSQKVSPQESAAPAKRRNIEMQHPELFAKLSELRAEFARAQHVPPYFIFTDATLHDMCVRLPDCDEDFLAVSGVGKAKLEKYGEQFMNIIKQFTQDNNLQKPAQEIKKPRRKAGSIKPEFTITQEEKETVELSEEPVAISVFVAAINSASSDTVCKKLTYKKVADWLVEAGFLATSETDDGKKKTMLTDLSPSIGAQTVEKTSPYGSTYTVIVYDKVGQQFILDNLDEILL